MARFWAFLYAPLLNRQGAFLAIGAGLSILPTGFRTLTSGYQLVLLSLFRTRVPRDPEGRELFAQLASSEWALWATFPFAVAILGLGIRSIFGGIRSYRTGRDHPFVVFAAMLMLGILLQAITGAHGLRDLRTEMIISITVLGLPWIDAVEERLRRMSDRRRP